MITNKDLRVEGSNIIINGEKHPLDPAVNALTKRANIVQGKLSALDTKLNAIEALEKTASGNPISITGAAQAYAMTLSMTIEPVQSGSGDPSPTNVRPISGLTEGKVFDYGKNLVDITKLTSIRDERGITFTLNGDGSVTANGTSIGRCQIYWVIPNNSATQFAGKTLSGNLVISNDCSLILELDGSPYTEYARDNGEGDVISNDIATVPGQKGVCLIWRIMPGVTLDNVTITPRISDAATATITFGKTVYGGSVNFKTGEVTVTHANISSYNGESINEPWLSSLDKYESGATPTTGAQVVYPLSTPTTLTLTPAELELLKGANTISGNGVNISISYIGR